MALPVAHALFGASVAAPYLPKGPLKGNLKTILIAAGLGVLPDFDYLFYKVLDWGESWHRSFSHSLVFALIVGAVAAFVFGPFTTRLFVLYTLAIFSHPILDALISEYPSGVQLLWPFSKHMFSFALVDYPTIFGQSHETSVIVARVLLISLAELLAFTPVLIASLWLSGKTRMWGKNKLWVEKR
jgi:membrane-bound metal-dependent hydrolase YbcI (DUF457 family)